MSQSIPISDLENTPSAKFANFGDTYVGRVTSIKEQNQTDPTTGAVKYFPSGDVMTLHVITIQPDDGSEPVALWAKAGRYTAAKGTGKAMIQAIVDAVKAAGGNSIDVGARLAVRYTGESEANKGLNPAKLFQAQYTPPVAEPTSLPVDIFSQS